MTRKLIGIGIGIGIAIGLWVMVDHSPAARVRTKEGGITTRIYSDGSRHHFMALLRCYDIDDSKRIAGFPPEMRDKLQDKIEICQSIGEREITEEEYQQWEQKNGKGQPTPLIIPQGPRMAL